MYNYWDNWDILHEVNESMIKLLHFSDAHIDIASQGKRDPQSGLPVRVLDFLKALDTIIDAAIQEKVDLVIFSGDAYKDRTPVPTFQREWGKRIIRLSQAKIPTILLVGNHDISPTIGRASALQEFDTLEIPYVRLVGKPCLIKPTDINNLPIQIIGLPWITRSGYLSTLDNEGLDLKNLDSDIEGLISNLINNLLEELDPNIPTILTAHASIQGAVFGEERSIMLGQDMVIPLSFVKKNEFDYVALGHIHKAQNLNEDFHPPIIYPGSIEKVDFGEVKDDKFFVIAEIKKGETKVFWKRLSGRIFLDFPINLHQSSTNENSTIPGPDLIKQFLIDNLPDLEEVEDAIVRVTLTYPKDWENLIDDVWIHTYLQKAFEVHLIRKPIISTRLRIGEDQTISSFPPEELLKIYWQSMQTSEQEIEELQKVAKEIIYNQSDEMDN